MISPEARERLASQMDDRRLELGLRWRDVAETGGVSYEALRDVRNGTGGIRRLTEHAIETGLHWEPGSVKRILEGGEPVAIGLRPVAASDDPVPDLDATEAMRQDLERHIEEVQLRVRLARLGNPQRALTGEMVFAEMAFGRTHLPASPRDARMWDALIAIGEPEPAVIQGTAATSAWHEQKARARESRAATYTRNRG